jgi:hypothetical protein
MGLFKDYAPQHGQVVDRVEGADAAALTQAVQKRFSEAATVGSSPPAPPVSRDHPAVVGKQSVEQRIKQLLSSQEVMLFMKVCVF